MAWDRATLLPPCRVKVQTAHCEETKDLLNSSGLLFTMDGAALFAVHN